MAMKQGHRDAAENVAILRANSWNGFAGAFALSLVYAALAWDHIERDVLLLWSAASWIAAVAILVTMRFWVGQRTDAGGLPRVTRVAHLLVGATWGSLFLLSTEATLAAEPPLIELCVVFALSAGGSSGTGFPQLGRDLMLPAWALAIVGTAINGQTVVALGCAAFLFLTLRNQSRAQRQFDEFRDLRHRADDAAEVSRALAETDALTGLPNRIALARASRALAESGETRLLAVFVDLDDFKEINDNHGHLAGDEVLRTVASRLRSLTRHDDFVGRLGGDEFFMLLTDVDGDRWPDGIQADVVAAIAEPMQIGEHVITITTSVGTHVTTTSSFELDEAYSIADLRMYEHKRSRRPDLPEQFAV